MSNTEPEIIKRQLNYYLDKNIDTLKNKFYGKDGIWSRYQEFIDRFKIDDKKIEVKINNSWRELNLEAYCLGLKHKDPSHKDENNFGAFSWWVEHYLKDLGSVGGTSSGSHGIYYSHDKKSYQNSKNKEVNEDNNTSLQKKFENETYCCIKNKLGLSTNNGSPEDFESKPNGSPEDFESKPNGSPEDFECKPKVVVLNKIYYLFKMQELDKQGCAIYHLIPIFKAESIKAQKDTLDLKFEDNEDKDSWEVISAKVYKKFEEFLNDRPKDEVEALFKVPSAQERQKNANLVEIKDDNLIKIAQNLFKSYCFGCFYWDVLEKQVGLSNKIDELISRGDKNIILTGAPGTGKTFACQSYAREQVLNFITENKITENKDNLENAEGNQLSHLTVDYFIKTVQFHPGYDYSDFIEGLRPKKVDNSIIYDRKDGIFKEFCKKVVLFNQKVAEFNNKPENKVEIPLESSKFFFIIDEINRGEVSKIFGEAFSMIENDKRSSVDSNSEAVTNKVDTQYSSLIEDKDPFQNGFYIPENVYILATMNEIDRSLEAMDFAFRRRFSWLTVNVKDTLNEIIVNSVLDDCTNSVSSSMSAIEDSFNELNKLIKNNLEPDYMLGGSYLTSLKNSSRTSVKSLKEELWNNHLEPIIKDYLKGTGDEIQKFKNTFCRLENEDSKKAPLNVKQ